ncbi:amino acid ABC transporter substrate-binding protein [Teichococcus cervicalis]|uniref:Lysine-arginine-ornithine-binding periplasmic protein n=1 Tax=Pseudoroseomonas cervicalis ATCC 49957 TaxID=525371 RepID=D5RTP5_9PROT|nr:amino acid ABC transporter substrate-binding protein [Pseudoroseomonas cervicalis]EFH09324.1 lysine-arginine-ornithine-binding periplasmic protein [Pseudoroseomonas cervicalis ATCC 49957]
MLRTMLSCLAATLLASAAAAQGSGSPTLDAVRARGQLACGVSGTNPGFALADSRGEMRGSEADFCRAVAAATLGDAGRVKFVVLTSTNRFTALQSGEIDLLVRTATWSLGREASLGLLFAGITFHDGTAFMVHAASGVRSAAELDGATICILPGTTTELAVTDYFRRGGMRFTPVLIDNVTELRAAFRSGRCDSYSSDASALASFRFGEGAGAGQYALLPEVISKEPLGPLVRKGDDKWFDIVRWTHFAMLAAEELGIRGADAEAALASPNPDIRRLLGVDGDLGRAMGLDNRWAFNILRQVGNYAEVWDRNIAPLGVPRGHNRIWTQGGLQYAPPIR